MKTIIIGAGAAGLAAAITAAENGADVVILEHENKPGKKILIAGNGKCNLTNMDMNCSKYYGDEKFIENVLSRFCAKDAIAFFHKAGLLTKDKKGYIYPMSEQATTVLNTLRDTAICYGVKIKTNNRIEKIEISDHGFDVYCGIKMHCDKLILATGGMAAPKTGSDGSGYELAKLLGHHVIKPKPALTALVCNRDALNKAAGVRVNAKVTINKNEADEGSDLGEVQITDYGISGIPVFNISRLAKTGSKISLDFMPEYDDNQALHILREMLEKRRFMPLSSALNGYFNDKLAQAILGSFHIDKSVKENILTNKQIEELKDTIKNYPLKVKSRRGFDYAQMTQGGIDTKEINSNTMESKLVKNLYFVGEMIDVDGICGGYNLHFAWATGVMAGGNCHE